MNGSSVHAYVVNIHLAKSDEARACGFAKRNRSLQQIVPMQGSVGYMESFFGSSLTNA